MYRAVARDGTVAAMMVDGGGVIDVYAVGSIGPQPEPSMLWLAPSFGALRRRNPGRLRDAVFAELAPRRVDWATVRGTLTAIGDGGTQVDTEELEGEELGEAVA